MNRFITASQCTREGIEPYSVPLAIMTMMTGKENMHLGLEFYKVWSFLFTVELFILDSLNCKFHNYAWSQILAYINLRNVHFTLVDGKKVQGLLASKIERQSNRIEHDGTMNKEIKNTGLCMCKACPTQVQQTILLAYSVQVYSLNIIFHSFNLLLFHYFIIPHFNIPAKYYSFTVPSSRRYQHSGAGSCLPCSFCTFLFLPVSAGTYETDKRDFQLHCSSPSWKQGCEASTIQTPHNHCE